jgi:hypothetical protein
MAYNRINIYCKGELDMAKRLTKLDLALNLLNQEKLSYMIRFTDIVGDEVGIGWTPDMGLYGDYKDKYGDIDEQLKENNIIGIMIQ